MKKINNIIIVKDEDEAKFLNKVKEEVAVIQSYKNTAKVDYILTPGVWVGIITELKEIR